MHVSRGSGISPSVTFGDLPDKLGQYTDLRKNESYVCYQMCVPPVFDLNNHLTNPLEYQDKIPNGTLVIVHGNLKM